MHQRFEPVARTDTTDLEPEIDAGTRYTEAIKVLTCIPETEQNMDNEKPQNNEN